MTVGANEVLPGAVNAEAHEHLAANVVEGAGSGAADATVPSQLLNSPDTTERDAGMLLLLRPPPASPG